MKVSSSFFMVAVLVAMIFSPVAEAKKRRKKKEKSNPDIRCTLDSKQNGERELVEVRLAKLVRNKGGKIQTAKINTEDGEKLCNSISQILWKTLVEGKAERNCDEPLKIHVRGKNHKICIEDSQKPGLETALKEVDEALTKN